MCIAVYKPKNVVISKEILENCFDANPDGAGFVCVIDGKLHMEKGFFTFDEFYDAYLPFMEHQALIHFRIKTHGKVDATNCHPFMISDKFAFIHNGTISGHGTTEFSDTYMFNEEILKPMVARHGIKILWQSYIKKMLEDYIGWSKLIFLDAKGNFNIYNEIKGEWDNGVWYSNTTYKPRPVYHYKGGSYLPSANPTSYYLERANGLSIHEGDYAQLLFDTSNLRKGEWVEVTRISKYAVCTVIDMHGVTHHNINGSVLTMADTDACSTERGNVYGS